MPEFEMPKFKYFTHIVINMFEKLQVIYLAGGCFWGVEAFISRLKGVNQTEVGYANGHDLAPTYEKVSENHCPWGNFGKVLHDYRPSQHQSPGK